MKTGRKIISQDIIKNAIELFLKLAPNDTVKSILAQKFLPTLIRLINKYMDNKMIVKNGVVD
jgi:hypothetical protein